MDWLPAVYILANKYRGTLYVGVTSDLPRRLWEHKNNVIPGFTNKYNIHRLVYYECFEDIYEAISREKQLKAVKRWKKITLIESLNPDWNDLYFEICC